MNSLHEALLSDIGDPSLLSPSTDSYIKSLKTNKSHDTFDPDIPLNLPNQPSSINSSTGFHNPREERIVSFVFWLIGVGILLPWNAFTSAAPYFQSRLCHSSHIFIRDNFEAIFGFMMNFSAVLSLVTVILYPTNSKKPISEKRKRNWNILPLFMYTITFLFATVYIFLPALSPDSFFYLTIAGLFICGASGSIAGANFVSLASVFPTHMALNPYFSGQGLGLVLLVTVNFVLTVGDNDVGVRNFYKENCYEEDGQNSNAQGNTAGKGQDGNHTNTMFSEIAESDPSDKNDFMDHCPEYTINMEAFFYFTLAIVVLIACVIGYILLERLAITRFYKESAKYSHLNEDTNNTADHHQDDDLFHSLHLLEMEADSVINSNRKENENLPSASKSNTFSTLQIHTSNEANNEVSASKLCKTWKMLSLPSLSIFVNLMVTLAIFPAWDNKLSSIHQCQDPRRIYNDLFFPFTFIVYYFFDLVGRISAGYMNFYQHEEQLHTQSKQLFIVSVLRCIFIPLFLFSPAHDSIIPKIAFFQSDWVTLIMMALFALSNGIILTMCFSVASDIVGPSMDQKEKSSMIMNLSMNVGLLLGSFMSFVMLKIGTGVW